MHHYRQALMRMRQGDSDRDIARSRLMGRRSAAAFRTMAVDRGWLTDEGPLPDDEAIAVLPLLERREDELVSGHAMPRVIVLLSTSAPTLEELEAASDEIERLAQQSALDVVRLYGEHDQGFGAAALPLGQGLR